MARHVLFVPRQSVGCLCIVCACMLGLVILLSAAPQVHNHAASVGAPSLQRTTHTIGLRTQHHHLSLLGDDFLKTPYRLIRQHALAVPPSIPPSSTSLSLLRSAVWVGLVASAALSFRLSSTRGVKLTQIQRKLTPVDLARPAVANRDGGDDTPQADHPLQPTFKLPGPVQGGSSGVGSAGGPQTPDSADPKQTPPNRFLLLPVTQLRLLLHRVTRSFPPGFRKQARLAVCSSLGLNQPLEPRDRGVWWNEALQNFQKNPTTHILIPFTAAAVGWITNWLAVQMIFWPLDWLGIPIYRKPGEPLGLIGWQGIVPAKSAKMAGKMVDVTISQLLSIQEAFGQLDARQVTQFILPTVGRALHLPGPLHLLALPFTYPAVRDILRHVEQVLDINKLVVSYFTSNKSALVELFQRVGAKELRFLVDSGTYFGFLLGGVQMVLWMFFPRPWTMPVAGTIVGTLTNWIALKWIFEPVRPVPLGPFVVHGMFLRRQNEVSDDFCQYVGTHCLTSKKVWAEMLFGGRAPRFRKMLDHDVPLPRRLTGRVFERIQEEIGQGRDHPLHGYCDRTLGIERLLRERMKLLSPEQFENVMHPVFQEDELTLIIAGAVLGGLAGFLQLEWDKWWERRAHRSDPPPSDG